MNIYEAIKTLEAAQITMESLSTDNHRLTAELAECKRIAAEKTVERARLADELAEARELIQQERDSRHERFLEWRGILENEYDNGKCCKDCSGTGYKSYGSTSTWHGGIGGQQITSGVCDKCWGSGDINNRWTNLKVEKAKIQDLINRAEKAEAERDELKYSNKLLCEGAESENQRALIAEVERDRYRKALERIANPYEHKWYKSANDGDDVVDSMIAIAREALKDATTLEAGE